MKKIFLLMVLAAMLFSCQKEQNDPVTTEQDVSFMALQLTPDVGLKNNADVIPCKENTPDFAWIKIDGLSYYPALFTLDGKLYTQAIKLAPGLHNVQEFVLYDDVDGVVGITGADVVVFGTPQAGSTYAAYVTHPLTYEFSVEAFKKAQIEIEVLCFQDHLYTDFGFFWFHITEIVIREKCFFGDICLNGYPYAPADFTGSPYAQNGLQEDEPAIFEVRVFKGGVAVPNSPFSNLAWFGTGAPLCVVYPDVLGVQETFTFELWVLVKVGNVFLYQLIDTYTSVDDGPLFKGVPPTVPVMGTDGIIDFAIGNCSPMSTNIYPWPATYYVTVTAGDLATGFTDPNLGQKWFFYNDETDVIDNTLGSFVAGPGAPPVGTGSAQINVSGTQRRNLATYQFAGTPLNQITTLAYSTYNASATNFFGVNASGYLQFNVDFNGTDTWQKRLVFLPSDNGVVTPDNWKEWDALNGGNALWRWSGATGGGVWPDGVVATTRTWNNILAAFPAARIRVSDPFLGIRVGEPYAAGYTENLDAFKFQTNAALAVYNFDN